MIGLTSQDIARMEDDDTPTATPHCICRNVTCEGYSPKLVALRV